MRNDPLKDLYKMDGLIHQLDEPVPIEFQKLYLSSSLKEKLSRGPAFFKDYDPKEAEKIIYDENAPEARKIQSLIFLGSSIKVEALRVLEDYLQIAKPGELRNWALMAHFECKVAIMGDLLDETQVAITSGLGGKGRLMRFMGLFFSHSLKPWEDFQIDLMKKELAFRLEAAGGEVEKFEVGTNWLVCTLLYPFNPDIAEFVKKFINECNQYGHFVSDNCLLTNSTIIDQKVIDESIEKFKQKREHPSAP